MEKKLDDGLGLSLSFAFPSNLHSISQHKSSCDVGLNSDSRSCLRGIDENRRSRRPPSATEEEVGVSSPNSTISCVSGKRNEREENESCRGWARARGNSGREDGGGNGGETARKKLRLSKEQLEVLEETFKEHIALNQKQKEALAKQLNLQPRQLEVWFQNRRARTKLKQTEADCEYLKQCCENLTVENSRLQKEVNKVRALKLFPQAYMQLDPPITLTMCPSCERVTAVPKLSPATDASTTATSISRWVPIIKDQNPATCGPRS